MQIQYYEKAYYQYTGQGDVARVSDAAGNTLAAYAYDAFGNVTNRTGTLKQPYGYRGYQYDEDAKLYYLNARYYDPDLARFISEDTYRGNTADPLSLNRYTYCSNNPIRYIDPSGYAQWEASDADLDVNYREMLKAFIAEYKKAQEKGDNEGILKAESLANAVRRIFRRHEAYKKQAYKSYEINKKEVNDNLTGEWGDENVWGVGYFDSADEAAQDFAENYYGITAYAGIEIATMIYPVVDQDGNVKYTYMLPTTGTCGAVYPTDVEWFLPLESRIITGMELSEEDQMKYDALPAERKAIYDKYRQEALADRETENAQGNSLRVSIAHTHPDTDSNSLQYQFSGDNDYVGDKQVAKERSMDIYLISAETQDSGTKAGRSQIRKYNRYDYGKSGPRDADNGVLIGSFQYKELSDEQKEALRYRYGDVYQISMYESGEKPFTGDDFLTGNYDAKKRKDYEEILNELFSIK